MTYSGRVMTPFGVALSARLWWKSTGRPIPSAAVGIGEFMEQDDATQRTFIAAAVEKDESMCLYDHMEKPVAHAVGV